MVTHPQQNSFNFTMFYDGDCPICMREVRMLMRKDTKKRIRFIDTTSSDFVASAYSISSDPDRLIHGMTKDGHIVTGMEVFRQIYSEIGLGWLLAPTGWPVLKPLFDKLYLCFARNRKSLGKLLGRKCESNTCE